MLWFILAKDTLYLHKKKPLILKPVETTVEEENFRKRFSINELVYPDLVSKGHFGRSLNFYQLIGGITPVMNFSFAVRGMYLLQGPIRAVLQLELHQLHPVSTAAGQRQHRRLLLRPD
ncbi:MAG: hypothetical protein GXO29_00450 [Thermotogae bacterium]|nr:hypothetical protein [Thermotogota bacterium]